MLVVLNNDDVPTGAIYPEDSDTARDYHLRIYGHRAVSLETEPAKIKEKGSDRYFYDQVDTATSIKASKETALFKIRKGYKKALGSALEKYIPEERETWTIQVEEAKYLEDGGSSDNTPLLSGMANERGISIEEMKNKVLEKDNFYRNLAGPSLGKYQRLEKQIEQAANNGDKSTLDSISWE